MKKFLLCAVLLAALVLTGCADKQAQPQSEPNETTSGVTHESVVPDASGVTLRQAEPDDVSKAFINICPDYEAYYIEDFAAVAERYIELYSQSEQTGMVPVIVLPDTELAANVYSNLDLLEYSDDGFENAPKELVSFGIKDIRSGAEDTDGRICLAELSSSREPYFDITQFAVSAKPAPELDDVMLLPETEARIALILLFPTDTPWDILCSVPPGGWNECPGAFAFAAIARYWYDECGAVPALISSRCVQFRCDCELGDDYAVELATELYSVAPESEMFKDTGAAGMAEYLKNAEFWKLDWIRTR